MSQVCPGQALSGQSRCIVAGRMVSRFGNLVESEANEHWRRLVKTRKETPTQSPGDDKHEARGASTAFQVSRKAGAQSFIEHMAGPEGSGRAVLVHVTRKHVATNDIQGPHI